MPMEKWVYEYLANIKLVMFILQNIETYVNVYAKKKQTNNK